MEWLLATRGLWRSQSSSASRPQVQPTLCYQQLALCFMKPISEQKRKKKITFC